MRHWVRADPKTRSSLGPRGEIEAAGLFEVVDIRHFDWERIYPVEEYIDLLNTFSNHILMEEQKRDTIPAEYRHWDGGIDASDTCFTSLMIAAASAADNLPHDFT